MRTFCISTSGSGAQWHFEQAPEAPRKGGADHHELMDLHDLLNASTSELSPFRGMFVERQVTGAGLLPLLYPGFVMLPLPMFMARGQTVGKKTLSRF